MCIREFAKGQNNFPIQDTYLFQSPIVFQGLESAVAYVPQIAVVT